MTRLVADWIDAPATRAVCTMLTDAGHQAWFVGGCVRNGLLNQPVSDIDITTDARPNEVIDLATTAGLRAVPTGIDHGTVTVIADDTPFEITTFRRDVATDGRRAVVAFADSIAEDALRRDFTMNALYADPQGVISDPINGLPDLWARRIRFIEDPSRRIKEDYLRILRFFRFSAWYGDPANGIDADGLAACAAHVDGIDTLPAERIWAEFRKLLGAPDPAMAVAARGASGAVVRVLPGAMAQGLAVLVHVEQSAGLSPDALRRLAVLGGQTNGLRLSRVESQRLTLLQSDSEIGAFAFRHGAAIAIDRLAVLAASSGMEIDPKQVDFAHFAAVQTFPVKAADLMPRLQGPTLGHALREAEERWIASGFTLTRDDLLG